MMTLTRVFLVESTQKWFLSSRGTLGLYSFAHRLTLFLGVTEWNPTPNHWLSSHIPKPLSYPASYNRVSKGEGYSEVFYCPFLLRPLWGSAAYPRLHRLTLLTEAQCEVEHPASGSTARYLKPLSYPAHKWHLKLSILPCL